MAVFMTAWGFWLISWIAAAFWSRTTQQQVGLREAWRYRLPIVAGAILIYYRISLWLGAPRLWHVGYDSAYALAGITIGGIAFAWWARLHLGSLWSSSITLKEDHRIVDSGPYALVRHPIYTGLLTSTIASAAAVATWPAVAGATLIIFGLWTKARMEERFLTGALDIASYDAYRRRVPMLLPFGPAGT